MKKIFKLTTIISILLITLSSCKSSVEVINAWKSDKLKTLVDQNILVITRTENNKKRRAFENQMVAYLKKKNIKASTSYMKIPIFNDQREYTDKEKKELVKK